MHLTYRIHRANAATSTTSVHSGSISHAKILTAIALAFIILQVPFFVRPVSATAPTTVYVSSSGSDTTGDGSASLPFKTITHAMSVVASTGTVMVEPGTYNEMVNITAPITLRSASSNPSDTVIDATGLSMGVFVNGAGAAGARVMGFTVENANDHGIYAQDTSGVVIENNFVTNNGLSPNSHFSGEDKAVEAVGTSYVVIAKNTVVANLYGGIALNDNGPTNPGYFSPGIANPSLGNLVTDNVVVGNKPHHCAIVVSAYNAGEGVINNIVSNNVVIDDQSGVIVAANVPDSQAINNSVIFNTIMNNGEGGVVIHANAAGAVVSGTLLVGNTFSGNGGPTSFPTTGQVIIPKYTGIIVGGEDAKIQIQSTTITGNVFHNEYYGIYVVNGTGTVAYGNTVDQSVTVPIYGATMANDPVATEVGNLTSTVTALQSSLAQLQASAAKSSDLTSLTSTVNSMSQTLSNLQNSAAKQSDLAALSTTVNGFSSDIDSASSTSSTASYVAYAALALAIVLLGLDVVLFRRRPSPA